MELPIEIVLKIKEYSLPLTNIYYKNYGTLLCKLIKETQEWKDYRTQGGMWIDSNQSWTWAKDWAMLQAWKKGNNNKYKWYYCDISYNFNQKIWI